MEGGLPGWDGPCKRQRLLVRTVYRVRLGFLPVLQVHSLPAMIASSIGKYLVSSFSNRRRASLESGTLCTAPYRHSFLLSLPSVPPSLLMHLTVVAPHG